MAGMLLAIAARAQNADILIASGREALAREDVTNAYASFDAAVAVSPGNPTARALRGVSRLLSLPYQSQAAGFLDRLGISPDGRNPLAWHASLPEEADGSLRVPTNMTAADGIAALRNIVLPGFLDTASDFAAITDPAFVLNLSEEETGSSAVNIDVGDLRLLRSFLHFFRYFGYTLNEWNFDIALQDLRDALAGENGGIVQFLETYPDLLSLASTNDAASARAEFLGFYTNYVAASEFIRNRPASGGERLFALDAGQLRDEARFRTNLVALRATLDQPGALETRRDLVFDLGRHFGSPVAPRQLLPQITDDGIVAGSLPDSTFGGVVAGIGASTVEQFLLTTDLLGGTRGLRIVPRLGALRGRRLDAAVMAGRSYRIEISADMARWVAYESFVAGSSQITLELPQSSEAAQFYRLVELTRPVNDLFDDRIFLEGEEVHTVVDLAGVTWNLPTEPGYPALSVWFEWTAPRDGVVRIATVEHPYQVFVGTNLASLVPALSEGIDVWPVDAGDHLVIAVGSWPWMDSPSYIPARITVQMLPVIPNDAWTNAAPLLGNSLVVAGHNFGAQNDPDPDGPEPLGKAVWWKWEPSATGRYVWYNETFNPWDFGGGNGEVLAVYRVRDGRPEAFLNGGVREMFVDVVGGESYAVVVFGEPSQFRWTGRFAPPLANDLVTQAVRINGAAGSIGGSTLGADLDDFEFRLLNGFSEGRSMVWYRLTPSSESLVEWSFAPGETDPVLKVFSGTAPVDLVDLGGFPATNVLAGVPAGADQWVAVIMDRFSGQGGPFTLNWRSVPRETNDLFAARASLSGNTISLRGRSVGAATEIGEPVPFLGPRWRSVWWTWTAEASGLLTIRVGADGGGWLAGSVFTGTGVSSLTAVPVRSSNVTPDGANETVVAVTAGVSYHIQVCSDEALESFDLGLRFGQSNAPSNDTFAARPALSGVPVVVTGSNRGADLEQGEPVPVGTTYWQASIWWSWTAPSDGQYTITTDGSGFDTLLGVYTGTVLNSLFNVGRDDDSGAGAASLLSFFALAGETYAIQVAGFDGSVGDVRLEIRRSP